MYQAENWGTDCVAGDLAVALEVHRADGVVETEEVLADADWMKRGIYFREEIHTQSPYHRLDPGLGLQIIMLDRSLNSNPSSSLHLKRIMQDKTHTSMPGIAQEHRVPRPIISNEPMKRLQHVLSRWLVRRPSVLGLISQHDQCTWVGREATIPNEVLADVEGIVDAAWMNSQ
jgi:hypothetical protein